MGLKHLINNWILKKALEHLSRSRVAYKSSLHIHFKEEGVKTYGRFNLMLTVLLVIQKYTDRFIGIKSVSLMENAQGIIVNIGLTKITRLFVHKVDIERELSEIVKKDVELSLKLTDRLFGLDYYNVT